VNRSSSAILLFCLAPIGLFAAPVATSFVWQTNAGVRSAPLAVPAEGKPGFTPLAAAQTGLGFTNHLSDATAAVNQIRLIGSGVALGDVDGDGWCDVFLCRLEGGNQLWRNLGGWRFEDLTAHAGVACADQFSTGCALVDVDGDGDLDLFVNSIGGGTRLFFNDGGGRFAESNESGLMRKYCATSLVLADVEGDGDLDLYVANYRSTTIRSTGLTVLNVEGQRVFRPEDRDSYEFTPEGLLLEHGEPDQLYLNDGKGRFTPVSWTSGAFLDEDGKPLAAAPKDWGLSAMFRDMDGNGSPDLYVCNDFWSVDRIWLNESRAGRIRFRAAPRLMLRNTSTFSMGVDFADINRDGLDDFLVLDMLSRDHPRRQRQRSAMGAPSSGVSKSEDRPQVERNTLFLNRGDGTYAEVAPLAGVQASEWSWSVAFVDVDLDGFEDALVTTGHAFDTQDVDTDERLDARGPVPNEKLSDRLLQYPRLRVANCAFRNRGDLTFEECGAKWGFATVGVKHGLALADLDNDGDLDVVINQLNDAVAIYRNDSSAPRVTVRLQGSPPNTRGLGATIKCLGGPVPQSQQFIAGGRYLSSDDAVRVFAAGKSSSGLSLEVTWPSGARSVVTNVQPNRLYELAEPAATLSRTPHPASRGAPLFSDATARLNHTHRDEPFEDFARQPLLPRRLSQLGPGVSWIDFDGDGRDDLIVTSGRGGVLTFLRNRGDGGFDALQPDGVLGQPPDDFTTALGWPSAPGVTTLLVGQANYETGRADLPAAHRFTFKGGAMESDAALPALPASPGPLALGDIDGDGDLDLFIGGRVVPGRYPDAATSRLYRNERGAFALETEWKELGLVSAAMFGDLDDDGFPELVLACEWGPVKLFRNHNGKLSPWDAPVTLNSQPSTLNQLSGWWNGVALGDFDGDGRLDLVASNWGRNTVQQPWLKDGWRVYYGDLAGRGSVELIEAFHDADHRRVVPWRHLDVLAGAMPRLRERFRTSAAFGEANLEQILGDARPRLRELRVNWLDSTLFLNRGGRFEARSLPVEAQFAPAFAVCVADADGDGAEDVFLAQNFFAVEPETSRHDAGRGLWLRGDGQGGLTALSGDASGVKVYGEQRGAAVCDYDGDGRVDLAVSQNNAATKLFRNETARPGIRVRLRGPEGNGAGVGAVMRVPSAHGEGPARVVTAGSGYWSQGSAVQVLPAPDGPATISVRWPGGKVTVSDLPAGTREIVLNADGAIMKAPTAAP
jgi:hypothetical protein